MKKWTFLLLFLSDLFAGCATPSGRERMEARQDKARPHPAAYDSGFYLNTYDPAERPVRNWDFYYKHCELVSRNPYPSKAEYDCTDPK